MILATGGTLSHYRLIEQIGEGGMGVVWRAADTQLARDVAVKVLPDAFATDPDRMARFEREARLLASVNHPHIAAIYGVGSAEGLRFLVMELVEGEDLAARLAHGPLPVAEAVDVARQIAEALEAAHERGVIHRDLKPANVKITPEGQVKVLDFGLAKAIEGEAPDASRLPHSPTITSPLSGGSIILGTAAYMSPEQARGKAVDRRADIWAFGCVLYECLTGRRAFSGETVSDTIAKILEREPDLEPLTRMVPARVREMMERCLAKDPKLRLRDIGDARIVLEEALIGRSPSGRLRVAEGGGSRGAKPRLLIVSLAVAAGAIAGVSLWGLWGPHHGGPRETVCVSVAYPEDLNIQGATITFDGRTLMLLAKPKQSGMAARNMVYTRTLGRYDWQALPGTEGALASSPTFDSRTVRILRPISEGSTQLRLYQVPIDGSAPPVALTDAKESWVSEVQTKRGDLLVLDGSSILRIPRDGGEPSKPLPLVAEGRAVREFQMPNTFPIQDGRVILVNAVTYDQRGFHYSVGAADLGTGRVKILVEDGGNPTFLAPGRLLFVRGDALLAVRFDPKRLQTRGAPVAIWSGIASPNAWEPGFYRVTTGGALFYRPGRARRERQLQYIDASGVSRPWSDQRYTFNSPLDISPDGRRFACVITNGRGIDEIWVSDVERPSLHRLGSDPGADCSSPIWSPDGATIAYDRVASDDRDGVYAQSIGGEPRRILKPESQRVYYRPSAWMPDGSGILMFREYEGKSGVVFLSLRPGQGDRVAPTPVIPTTYNSSFAKVSRDGRWVAFVSDESGDQEAYVAPLLPGRTIGDAVRVSTGGAGSVVAAWSPDGSSVQFLREQKLWSAPVTRKPSLSIGPPRELLDFEKLGIANASQLPDGRFLAQVKDETETPSNRVNLVLNWTSELDRRMRASR